MFETFFEAYIDCALWSSCNERGDSFERAGFKAKNFTNAARHAMRADCEDFWNANCELLAGLDPARCGRDFWLTRNRHGAGFWDRGLGDIGRKLTDAAHVYGESYIHEGFNRELHIS